ncbi:FAD:protein FMN transferase [Christensenellaceae bacterium OttesenSCG-928-L17]|nr:FAD:protein FMN transferase [Christensenellaceae bacterium OttesenSCG-928-L17]
MKKRLFCLLLVAACACSVFAGCQQNAGNPSNAGERQSAAGFYFDTSVTIVAYGVEKQTLDDAMKECARYEALLSKTAEGSDVWNINHAAGQPVAVSEDTLRIINTARMVSEQSNGMFDITIAPAAALWDFTGETVASLPQDAALKDAAARIDYRKVVVNDNTVMIPEGFMLDLGGIAKGYIADQIAAFLKDAGATHSLLNFGGNVVAAGGKPDKSPWSVGIQEPFGAPGAFVAVLDVYSSSVVTSGIYERGFSFAGEYYHHILDPHTGYPVQNELTGVTVLSESSMLGDALSTACMALGLHDGLALIASYEHVEAVFITREGELFATDGAGAYLRNHPEQ